MLLEALVPMMAYRLWPSRERLMRAARAILTEHDDLAERQLGAIYRHVKLDTQLPRTATEEELRGFGEPVALSSPQKKTYSSLVRPWWPMLERSCRTWWPQSASEGADTSRPRRHLDTSTRRF
jgi:hypothetical protein